MHDGDVGTGWMIVMMLGMALFWGGIAVAVVWLLREAIGHSRSDDPWRSSTAGLRKESSP